LGARDATTGWYAKSYADSTISMLIFNRGTQNLRIGLGDYVVITAVGYTQIAVNAGDYIDDSNSEEYLVAAVREHMVANASMVYECDLAGSRGVPIRSIPDLGEGSEELNYTTWTKKYGYGGTEWDGGVATSLYPEIDDSGNATLKSGASGSVFQIPYGGAVSEIADQAFTVSTYEGVHSFSTSHKYGVRYEIGAGDLHKIHIYKALVDLFSRDISVDYATADYVRQAVISPNAKYLLVLAATTTSPNEAVILIYEGS
jgi:hypothetical protein